MCFPYSLGTEQKKKKEKTETKRAISIFKMFLNV